jgi:hypothetical protein
MVLLTTATVRTIVVQASVTVSVSVVLVFGGILMVGVDWPELH